MSHSASKGGKEGYYLEVFNTINLLKVVGLNNFGVQMERGGYPDHKYYLNNKINEKSDEHHKKVMDEANLMDNNPNKYLLIVTNMYIYEN